MNIFKKILPVILIIAMMLSAVSCDNDKQEDPPKTGDSCDQEKYTVTVLNPYGKPMPDVTVYVHKDGERDYNVCIAPISTDSEGKAEFTLDPSFDYSVQLANYPLVYSAKQGNTPADRYAFENNSVTAVLENNDAYTPRSYTVGSPMANFSITDIDGNTYELAELLKTKKVVMLNFWFYGCLPCAIEFPAVNTAYASFSGDVEILAINDDPSDTLDHVEGYESYRKFDLDMPLFKLDYGSEVSITRFLSNNYPTTVIIDRYGIVSAIHVGAVTSTSRWNQLFEYYTSDSYDGTPYNF